MLKRKWHNGQRQPRISEISSDSDDQIDVAASLAERYLRECSESDGLTGRNEAVTPLTREKSWSSREDQGSPNELLVASGPFPKNTSSATNQALVPDCRDGAAYPRSLYIGWTPPLRETTEFKALDNLIEAHQNETGADKPDYTYFSLDDFSIYRPGNVAGHGNELVTLDRLSKDRYPEFRFDGVLSFGKHRYFVRNVAFAILTIDGYGDHDTTDMGGQLCIQSAYARGKDVWYKLGNAATEYRRFFQPFLWLARFTKHFVDYLLCTEEVTIADFRKDFHAWLQRIYAQEEQQASLQAWLREANLVDFRTTVTAHVEFLWKECFGSQEPGDDIKICKQPIWGEIHPAQLKAIPEQRELAKGTIVTPFAFDCFKDMYFADQFLETPITDTAARQTIQGLKAELGLTLLYSPPLRDSHESLESQSGTFHVTLDGAQVVVGDVVVLLSETDGRWNSTTEYWYAFVQRIHLRKDGRSRLDVIWLYHASDTTIGTAYYPFHNELFFSDNCGCDTKHHREAVGLEEVIGKVNISWYPVDPYREQGFFVRKKFRTVQEKDQYDFVMLEENDFRCLHQPDHIEEDDVAYALGDVVLVRSPVNVLCDIAQVVGGGGRHVRLRKLRRKRETLISARPNHLVFTSEVFEAYNDADRHDEVCQIVRKCHLLELSCEAIDAGDLPTPYDRDGAGDYFFVEADSLGDVSGSFPSINQGWDPRIPSDFEKLTGLSIFCGGGTFDRGLEEGGAVKFRYACDWSAQALHSHRANLEDPGEVQFFLGSVNDYLAKALFGQSGVAQPGSVQVISAGSPCQGFSRLQLFTASEESKQNASMVASVVSFADLYCPKYIILENVVSMTESRNERKGHNVFSQILGAFVALGYQVQQFLGDSWSHGSSQQRSRLFIIATAPGLTPPPQPPCSHAHPPHVKVRSLGKSSNGLPFSSRKASPDVALPHISPREAVGDLPPIYDSQPQLVPAFPDHRTATDESGRNRVRMRAVPIFPRGMTLVKARDQGMLSGEPLHFSNNCGPIRRSATSRMYSRVLPYKLFPTFVTKLSVGDGLNGQCMHWDQHRVLTIMEAKRGQGYLDHEVLVGSATQQMKIVGNSVDRKAALVLGLSLRESWLKSHASPDIVMESSDEEDQFESTNTDEVESRWKSTNVDNRTVKMSLILSEEDIERVNKVTATTGRTFKEILRILAENEEYHAARQLIHGAG